MVPIGTAEWPVDDDDRADICVVLLMIPPHAALAPPFADIRAGGFARGIAHATDGSSAVAFAGPLAETSAAMLVAHWPSPLSESDFPSPETAESASLTARSRAIAGGT
jgi:hypothetical protein